MEHKELLVLLDLRVHKERLEHKERLVLQELMELQV